MSEYIRTTQECSVNQLHPEVLKAIQAYFQEHKLGHLQAETLLCCETVSRKKDANNTIGRSDTAIYTGMLLTSQQLIWAHHGDHSGTRVNAANLNEIQAEFHTSPLARDSGLEIVGYISNVNARVRGYIGMGTGAAAQKFCEAVKEAVAKPHPPTKRDFFKWLTG